MVRRLIKDESGATMGLAVIMIVLIGVMGAGLLTFVATDLTAVAEASQGQKAFEMADAGVEAAKNQLKLDARLSYITATVETLTATVRILPTLSGLVVGTAVLVVGQARLWTWTEIG